MNESAIELSLLPCAFPAFLSLSFLPLSGCRFAHAHLHNYHLCQRNAYTETHSWKEVENVIDFLSRNRLSVADNSQIVFAMERQLVLIQVKGCSLVWSA